MGLILLRVLGDPPRSTGAFILSFALLGIAVGCSAALGTNLTGEKNPLLRQSRWWRWIFESLVVGIVSVVAFGLGVDTYYTDASVFYQFIAFAPLLALGVSIVFFVSRVVLSKQPKRDDASS